MSYIVWSRRCRKYKGQFYLQEGEDGTYRGWVIPAIKFKPVGSTA